MANLTKAKMELYVWRGAVENKPSIAQYTISKPPVSGEDKVVFEISELVKDYIDIVFDGNYDNIEQSVWASWDITRTYDDDTTDTYDETVLAFRGYGEIEDGINPELSTTILISNTVINNKCGSTIAVPYYDGVSKITYRSGGSDLTTEETSNVERYTIAQELRVNPPLIDIITIDKTHSTSASSDSFSKVEEVPVGTDEIRYTDSEGVDKTIKIECIDECLNTPHKISFINKFGVMQDIWFFARKRESITSERQQYKKNTLDTTGSLAAYKVSDHQRVYLENQGREVLTMNTGYIHESYSEVIKQLMVSEYVYIHDQFKRSPTNGKYDLAVPINIVTDSLDIKQRRYDKLIDYQLQFEADSELIQSIR